MHKRFRLLLAKHRFLLRHNYWQGRRYARFSWLKKS